MDADWVAHSGRLRVWKDAFPWISGYVDHEVGDDEPWWEWPIEGSDPRDLDAVIEAVISITMEHLGRWSIGEALPGLPPNISLTIVDFPDEARMVLDQQEFFTTGDLIDVRIDALLNFWDSDLGTASVVLRELARLAATETDLVGVGDQPRFITTDSPWIDSLLADLETLAIWNHGIGKPDRAALDVLPAGAPATVQKARERLFELSATQVLPSSPVEVADILDNAIVSLDCRAVTILEKRVFADHPITLDALGEEFNVTRERIRQLEKQAVSQLKEFLSEDGVVGWVAVLVRSQIDSVRPLTELLAVVPALALPVTWVGQPTWRVLDVLDDTYEIADGWCAAPSFDAVGRDMAVLLDELADEYGVVRLADMHQAVAATAGQKWLIEWLRRLGYQVRDDLIILKTGSLNNIAAAILSIEGAPLETEELHSRVGRGSLGSLRNALYSDRTFHRVGVQHWALTSWGMNQYANIRVEIGNLLEESGGELPLRTIVETLVERFGVSASSVSVYAGTAPYEIWNGIVRRSSQTVAGPGRNPAKVQAYYRRGSDWLYRTTVTRDHLRGSGWPASTALATILRMKPGENVVRPSRLGPQSFTYKSHQPAYGSIRRFLEDMDLDIGAEIFCVFGNDGTFEIEQLPETPESTMAQALRLVGADTGLSGTDALDALGAAIHFVAGADRDSIAAGYKARREEAIHDLIMDVESYPMDP